MLHEFHPFKTKDKKSQVSKETTLTCIERIRKMNFSCVATEAQRNGFQTSADIHLNH